MRVVVQRVKRASVVVDQQGEDTTAAATPTVVSEIGKGIVCLVGIKDGDEADDALWMCKQITTAKLFEGMSEANADKRWRSNVKQNGFEVLLVSQARTLGQLTVRTRGWNVALMTAAAGFSASAEAHPKNVAMVNRSALRTFP